MTPKSRGVASIIYWFPFSSTRYDRPMRLSLLPVLLLLAAGPIMAQPDDSLDFTPVVVDEKWYDTLTVTEPLIPF